MASNSEMEKYVYTIKINVCFLEMTGREMSHHNNETIQLFKQDLNKGKTNRHANMKGRNLTELQYTEKELQGSIDHLERKK